MFQKGIDEMHFKSQTVRLSILLVGMLLAFPYLYPLSRSFFRGNASPMRPDWDEMNGLARAQSTTAKQPVDRVAQSPSHVPQPALPRPDLIVTSSAVSPTQFQEDSRLVLRAPGPQEESFELLIGAGGRLSVHPDKPVLVAPRGRNVQFWDLERASLIKTRRIDRSDEHTLFTNARYSSNGQYIAFGSPYGPMKVLRLADDSLVPVSTDRSINGDRIAFHPNGQRLVAVGERTPEGRNIPNAHWVDLQSGESRPLVPDEVKIVDAVVSDDGQFIALAETQAISIYDTASLDQQMRSPLAEGPTCVVASQDGNWIVGLTDGTVRTWSSETGQFAPEADLDTGLERVVAIDRFDDSNRYCVVAGEGQILIWDRDTRSTRFVGHHESAHCIRAIPGERGVVTVGIDNAARLWPMPRPRTNSEPTAESQLAWSLVAVSADGSKMAAVGQYVHVWNVSDGKCLTAFEPKTRRIEDVCLSPDGSLIALVGQELKTEVWSVTEGRPVANYFDPDGENRWPRTIDRRSNCVRFSGDGRQLMVAEQDALRIYDVHSRQRVTELAKVVPKTGNVLVSMIQAMDTDNQSGRIALAQTGRIVVWDPDDERTLKTVETQGSLDAEHPGVFFSNDGKRIIVGHLYRVAVYDIESGRVLDELRSHWVHGRMDEDWLVSNREGQLSWWSPATEYVPAYERTRRRAALEPLMRVRGELKDIALMKDGTLVLIDQHDKPLVCGK
ncbi:WD40 repeat domain-containing protein [Roseiconus lacunae]|uniref:WD40 repeat domain-containing protein n=1 Tax=Roseiconus lacunae TaxID=2605694 RepID=A0ABT7PQ66_9BACT|nr:WD40 repeat domain-containing protein [Roseiconus lacunae]MDM4018618.1 WD40 repeat domain-containing protein [Roseiconus lacunae]